MTPQKRGKLKKKALELGLKNESLMADLLDEKIDLETALAKQKELDGGLAKEESGQVGGSSNQEQDQADQQSNAQASQENKGGAGKAGKQKAWKAKVNLHHNGKEYKIGDKIDHDPNLEKSNYIEEAGA